MLSWLLACSPGATPPQAAEPLPTYAAEVEVRSYRETDISKRQGHPMIHAYATLAVREADAALQSHAVNGELQINMRRDQLAEGTTLPWTVGDLLRIEARIATSTEGYVRVTQAAVVPPAAPVTVTRRWSGRARLATRAPGEEADAEPLILRSQAAFDAFVDTIPTERVQKKQPAPPSDDPLLQKPAIDFGTHMVLVALRDDMYVGPEIVAVRPDRDGLLVEVRHPPLGDTVHGARLLGMGTYDAVEVPQAAGTVRWVEK